jgi:trk system potassium uptake protein
MSLVQRYLGYVLIISGCFRIIPIVVGIIYQEDISSYFVGLGISIFLGLLLVYRNRPEKENKQKIFTLTQGLLFVAISFIILPLIGAFAFLEALDFHFLNAYFESISGYTTTGFTMFSSLDTLSKSLLIWRALTQWMGGIGIIMVFLFFFMRLHGSDYTRYAELESDTKSSLALYASQGFTEKIQGNLNKTVGRAVLIYCSYTILGIIALAVSGMTLINAIGTTFTAISTGGFSMTDSLTTNSWQIAILSMVMILGSISFITHNKLFTRAFKKFLTDFEKNVFLVFLLLSIAVVLPIFPQIKIVVFQLVSAFTTTGYSLVEIPALPQFFLFIIFMGMIVGGSIASSAGGLKVFRLYYLMRAIPWLLKKLSSPPNSVIPFTVHGQETDETRLMNIGVFVFFYGCIIILGTMVFMIYGYEFFHASFQMVSALGTVGLQTVDLTLLPGILKSILIFAMLLGRLEIFPLLILISHLFSYLTLQKNSV